MNKKSIAICLLAASSVLGVSSYASADEVGNGKKVVVAIWDNNQLAGLQQIAGEWSEKTGTEVEFEVLDWGSYWTTLEAGVSGGQMPDVFWMHSSYAQMYMDAGILLGLNDYIDANESIDLAHYYEGITMLYEKDGEQYAIPKDHDTIAMVYNKAIFDKYGVEYPTNDMTWEEYAEKAQQITDAGKDDGVYGTYMNTGSNQGGWYNIIYSFGGEVITEDKKKSGMDEENTIRAMQFVADKILPACPSQDSMANTGGDTMMISGNLGMLLEGSWMVPSYYSSDNRDDLAWVEIPYEDVNGNGSCDKEEKVSIYNGLGWSVYKDCENPDGAFSLIAALTDENGQTMQSRLGVTMAAYIGCSDAFVEPFEGMDISPFITVEENGTLVFRPCSKYSGRWEDNFSQRLIDAWNDPSVMEETCRGLADEMNAILASE